MEKSGCDEKYLLNGSKNNFTLFQQFLMQLFVNRCIGMNLAMHVHAYNCIPWKKYMMFMS